MKKVLRRQTLQDTGGNKPVTWGGGSSSHLSTGVCVLWMFLQGKLQAEHLKKYLKLISLQSLFESERNRADPAEDVGPKKKNLQGTGVLSAL